MALEGIRFKLVSLSIYLHCVYMVKLLKVIILPNRKHCRFGNYYNPVSL